MLASLFPAAPISQRSKGFIATAYGLTFLALTVTILLRQSGVPATNTIWGEDGTIYYTQALRYPFLHTLTTTYGGYYQLLPRLAIQITRLFPVDDAAAIIAILGAMGLSALALLVFHIARARVASTAGRYVLVGSIILLPLATAELLGNLVNLSWWLFFVVFWILLWRPRTRVGSVLAAVLCLLAAGTEPLVGLFLPLSILRFISVKGFRENLASIGLLLGLFYQAFGYSSGGPQGGAVHTTPQSIINLFSLRVGLGSFTGARATNSIIASRDNVWIALGLLIIVAVIVIACLQRDIGARLFVFAAIAYSVITFVVPVWIRGAASVMTNAPVPYGSRYSAVPILLVLSAVIVEADRLKLSSRRGAHTTNGTRINIGIVVCLLALLPTWIIDIHTPNERSDGPRWNSGVAQAVTACRQGHVVVRPVATTPVGWTAQVPCQDLR